jgi:competence protein ComEC
MSKKVITYLAGALFLLNIYAWNEVFVLSASDKLVVNFLDVGQGDSTFVETPQHHQILIDGGPDLTVLSKLQKLMPAQDRSIDLIILSHPEKDHFAGLLEVLKRYQVDYVLWTGIVRDTPEYKEWVDLLELSKMNGTKVITAVKDQEIIAGNVVIDTIYPKEDLAGQKLKNTSNDSGVVSQIIFGNNSLLFTGDISSVAEKEIVNSIDNFKIDVLKVAHHGSKYSTSDLFLERVKPEIAIISVGKNSYGHPTPETLQRLENFGIKVKRTDIDGDIKMVSDGNNITLGK